MNRFFWPLAGLLLLIGLLAIGLTLKPSEVPSPLIGKPAPVFSLPKLAAPDETFSPQSMDGKVWLLNVWASWCPPCLEEHPVITDLSTTHGLSIVGLNYKDMADDAIAWLQRHGDAYEAVITDPEGVVGIDYGVYGVPETYIIDKQGVIRYKHIGAVSFGDARDTILPLVRELQK
ncbi:DsbE family thiol:disulfide interchange protein [Pusillimonas sp. SM2304]|jgi:cytochrome c biogenesis protein CcmG/thiol:disulfide interchange protein DsbE|uniref:DsbE family thiol:disulfide interchange protein n=1 Tax=Pollutimonas thiosulfatoxidans TaxID=2028345 RepID=A0A410GCC3_9BURK|nr:MULTISPECIES: DsbE family thiol:disulfide interchange protein [Alcaligenaceae]MDS1142356.1 DsbE family thiol:disulfide interchange protein [Pusillimonas sp. SM2304]QAA93941.1 DsbE family thiol:disulfide interchange protein [Pollutimonas thiosulfatoxidans]TEA79702.1 DsbE family thiol:disulfide interchange protein [Allopusillimonas ginsengisoli]TFL14313.1 DsbE family thiol:disulfide interchange protein [Pusillimonas caeni]